MHVDRPRLRCDSTASLGLSGSAISLYEVNPPQVFVVVVIHQDAAHGAIGSNMETV
jgi:hypothetical protein